MSFWAITYTLNDDLQPDRSAIPTEITQLCVSFGFHGRVGSNIYTMPADRPDALATMYLLVKRIRNDHGTYLKTLHFFRMDDLNDASRL